MSSLGMNYTRYGCPGGKFIPTSYVCDGQPDCNGSEDESGCSKYIDKFKVVGEFPQFIHLCCI